MNRKSPFPSRRPILRWVDYARRSWQRLGHLRIVCSVADPATGTSLQGLTSRFEGIVTSLHKIPGGFEDQVGAYIRTYRTSQNSRRNGSATQLELQDLYLSDSRLPSQSGAITGDMSSAGYRHAVYVEMPAWGVRLRLIRRHNYTLTDRGKVLLRLRQGETGSVRVFNPNTNPYLLTPGERYFFLFCILDVDGDLLRSVLDNVSLRKDAFSRSEVGNIAADALVGLLNDRFSRPMGGQERVVRDRIAATVKSLANQKSSGMGPRESVATPRTEPLVDCGLLVRTDRNSYSYRMSEEGRQFARALVQAQSIDDFLMAGLAKWSVLLSGGAPLFYSNPEDVVRYVARSYSLLRSGLGYCSIREVALLADAMAIDEGVGFFELADAEQAVSEMARRYGKGVRFTKSRQGDIAQVRIAPQVLAQVGHA